jgi:hypothetical protein
MASAKQLAARRKFAKIMKSGGFKKRKSKSKSKTKTKTRTVTKIKTVIKRKTNKGGKKRSSVKRSLGLKSITGSSTIKKVALGIGGGVMATAILSAVMPNSSVAKFAAPAGAFALGGIEGVIGNFALSMLGSRTGSNTNVTPQMEAL